MKYGCLATQDSTNLPINKWNSRRFKCKNSLSIEGNRSKIFAVYKLTRLLPFRPNLEVEDIGRHDPSKIWVLAEDYIMVWDKQARRMRVLHRKRPKYESGIGEIHAKILMGRSTTYGMRYPGQRRSPRKFSITWRQRANASNEDVFFSSEKS